MTLGFYLGHVLEIAARRARRHPGRAATSSAPAPRARSSATCTATELVASEEAYLGPRVRALMVRLAARDTSTEEHTRRVALLAARVGEELKLSATARRHLAVGGLLHDIGKLSVPLEILHKPGADRRGVRRDQAPPGRRPASCSRSSAASPRRSAASSPTTTSASTAAATRAA